MKILISPAKTLDFESDISHKTFTKPNFIKKSSELIAILQKLSKEEISKLMSISDKLSSLNYDRFRSFAHDPKIDVCKQAILVFKGDVYTPIEVDSYNNNDFEFMQDSLRILSGLYGILKPLDLISPYRLEMSTRLKNDYGGNLYHFWNDLLSNYINEQCNSDEEIINLASDEYFKAVNSKIINNRIIKIDFKENKSGSYKTIGLHAKRARGEMVNYIVKNRITNSEQLLEFDVNNYYFNNDLSSKDLFCFTR